jgi:hypothetical protein
MTRESTLEHQEAVLAWLQGASEGTIILDPERRKALELEARVYGLLVSRSVTLDMKKMGDETIEKLLDFGPSSRLLKDTTTQRLLTAEKAGLDPGTKLKPEVEYDKPGRD